MRGIIKKFIKDKGFGFIEGNNGKEYFFHISNVGKTIENNEIIEGKNVEYQENSGPKGLYASEINFSEDFKKRHLRNRFTRGVKSSLNLKGNMEEIEISTKISEYFGITFSKEDIFKGSKYYFNFIQPSETYRESFNMFNEVLMLFSPYKYYDERSMDYVDKLFMDYSNRLDPVVVFLVSKDRTITEFIKNNSGSNSDTRIIVPFTYDEILSDQFNESLLQSRLRTFFYQRDLFAMESPLRSDNYFYGRNNVVHNMFDKYSIGEHTGLFGLRKTGKTSVLYAVERLVKTRKGKSIYIDCQDPSVYQLRWFELLEHIALLIDEKYELKLEVVKGSTFDEKNASYKFVSFLKEAYKISNHRILILFDEIEHITFNISRINHWKNGDDFLPFWQTLRSITQQNQDLCSFVIAGVNPMIVEEVSIQDTDNPIFNYFDVRYLDLFSLNDVKKMVGEIGSYMGLDFDDKVYYKLHEDYGGHPFLIRNVCSLLNAHYIDRPYEIGSRDYDDLKSGIDTKIVSYIKSILFVLETWYIEEFKILREIALGNTKKYRNLIKDNETTIAHLLGYGIVNISSNNNYYIEIEAIKDYMESTNSNHYIPNNIEEYREIISSRRNKIETELKNLVHQLLVSKYGKDGVNSIIEKILNKNTSIKTIQSRREDSDVVKALYFSELRNIITAEYRLFENNLGIDKFIFVSAMNEINKYRSVDAHADKITEEDYETLHLYFVPLEKALDIQ